MFERESHIYARGRTKYCECSCSVARYGSDESHSDSVER
jgi:hypothetical protein